VCLVMSSDIILMYKIRLLWHDTLIPLVNHGLYLCVE